MKNKYHYVYRITNTKENKHYYGVRSSNVEPKLDLGVKYFSSSTDKEFIQEQKENKSIFKYKIIKEFETREESIKLEIKLHNKFEVGKNKLFYNRAKQTSTGFTASVNVGKHLFNDDGTLKKSIYDKMVKRQRETPSRLGMKNSDFQKNRARETQTGKVMSDSTKVAISKSCKGKPKPNLSKTLKLKYENGYISNTQKGYRIFNNESALIYEFNNVSLKTFCKNNNLPYSAIYKSYRSAGSPLYQTTFALNKVKKKGYDVYKGWYCVEV